MQVAINLKCLTKFKPSPKNVADTLIHFPNIIMPSPLHLAINNFWDFTKFWFHIALQFWNHIMLSLSKTCHITQP